MPLGVTSRAGSRRTLPGAASAHALSACDAARATAGQNRSWLLSDYAESRFTPGRVLTRPVGERVLESTVSAGFLGLAVQDPSELDIASLWGLIGYFQANALDVRPYEFAFWSRIARTIAIAFAVLLAIPFVLGSLRSAGLLRAFRHSP